jgi:hypothetical protein
MIVIEDVSITGVSSTGVAIEDSSEATIHGLTVTGAQSAGIYVAGATAAISDYTVRYSNYWTYVTGASTVMIEHSRMTQNNTGLLGDGSSGAVTVRLSECVIMGNFGTGVLAQSGAQVITFRNNTWAGNSPDGSTPLSVSLK